MQLWLYFYNDRHLPADLLIVKGLLIGGNRSLFLALAKRSESWYDIRMLGRGLRGHWASAKALDGAWLDLVATYWQVCLVELDSPLPVLCYDSCQAKASAAGIDGPTYCSHLAHALSRRYK